MSTETVRSGDDEDGGWPRTLAYWRKLPADAFYPELREQVVSCVRQIASTVPDWQAAIGGDAAAATGIAPKLKGSGRISPRADLSMTPLPRCAFEDPGAALVLAEPLQPSPLP